MSILNAITQGGNGAWKIAVNTAASESSVSFPANHNPSDWILFRITNTTADVICYIDEDNGTHREWGLNGSNFSKGGTPTGAYNNGTFTVTRGSKSFSTAIGDYVLVYI